MLSHMHPQLAEFFQYRLAQQELMKELGESGVALSMQQDLRALRGWYKLFGQRVGGPILDMAEVSDLVADTDERPIRLRRYRPDITAMEASAPSATATDTQPSAHLSTPQPAAADPHHAGGTASGTDPHHGAPALIYFHGGGWSMGDLDTHDRVCRRLAHTAQAIVIAVDYALAPELPWPQAPHDSIAATRWILQNAAPLGIDARRVGVAGDSAGGNLAAIVALALPQLACQILIYPATDLRSGFHPQYPSLRDNAQRPPLTTEQMAEHMRLYLDGQEAHARHPQASPLLAPSHRGAAPALIITAELDPLRDDGAAYAQKLAADGVDVLHRNYAGLTHGFIEMADVLDCVPETFALMAQWFQACCQRATASGPASPSA